MTRNYGRLIDEAAERLEGIAEAMPQAGFKRADTAGLFVGVGIGSMTQIRGRHGAARWLRSIAARVEREELG